MKTAIAEQVISYECNCPYCGDIIFSEFQDDWDISTNLEYNIEIQCDECKECFKIHLPD